MKAQIIRSQRPRFVPSCSSVKSCRQSVSTALFFVVTSPTDRCCFLKVNSHGMKANATKKDFTVKVYVTVEVADTSVCVNRSICCHRTHCWCQEKTDVVTDVVAPCELAFRPIHETKLFRVWTFIYIPTTHSEMKLLFQEWNGRDQLKTQTQALHVKGP